MKKIILLVTFLIPVFVQGQQIKEQVSNSKIFVIIEYRYENKTAAELYNNFRIYLSDNYGVALWDRSVVNKYYQTKKSGTIFSDAKSPQNDIEADYDLEVDFSDNLVIYKASSITYSCSAKDIKDLSIEDLRNNKLHLTKAELNMYKEETPKYFLGHFSKMNKYLTGASQGKRKIQPELKMNSNIGISERSDQEIAIPAASVSAHNTNQTKEPQENMVYSDFLVNQAPAFPGGQQALDSYVADHLKYSDKIKADRVAGKVVVSFIIEKDGSISALKIIRGLCAECDKEIIRVLKTAPKWKPAMNEGKIVRVSRYLSVPFNI